MAITLTNVVNNPNKKTYTVKSLDADTGPTTIAHGMPTVPVVTISPATTAIALAGAYAVTADATNITISKQNAANSGGTTPGTTVVAIIVAEQVIQG
jgi:hypothetical protein